MADMYMDINALNPRKWDDAVGGDRFGQRTTANENISAMPQIAQLTQLINSINQTAQQRANAGRIPGGSGLEATSSGNIGQALAGRLPQDVINLIGQQAAERGVASGSPLGPSSSAAFLRSLGLSSLDLMGQGQNWLSAATNRNPAAPLFDPSAMLLSPYQTANLDLERQRLAQSGRGGGGGGRGYADSEAPTMTGSGINWSDLFGGGGRGLTYGTNIDSFPYGVGTNTGTGGPDMLFADQSGYAPNIPFGSSLGGYGLWDENFGF